MTVSKALIKSTNASGIICKLSTASITLVNTDKTVTGLNDLRKPDSVEGYTLVNDKEAFQLRVNSSFSSLQNTS